MRRQRWIELGSAVIVGAAFIATAGNRGLMATLLGLLLGAGLVVAVVAVVRASRGRPIGAVAAEPTESGDGPGFDLFRGSLGMAGVAGLLFAAFLAWIVTIIVATGCFIGCSEESRNRPLAAVIGVVAIGLVAGAARLAAWALVLRADVTRRLVGLASLLAAVVLVVSVVFG